MFEAYAIGVTLKLHNLVSPQLAILAQEFERLERLQLTVLNSLRKIGESKSMQGLGLSAKTSTDRIEKAAIATGVLERKLEALRLASHLPMGTPNININGLPPTGARGGGGHGHAGGLHGGNIHMGPNGVGIGTVGMAAGAGFVPLAAGAAMVWGGHALYESAKDLNTEMQKFKLYGLGDKLNEDAFKFVRGMHIYGTTQAENMKEFREAQGIFRESGLDDEHALEGAKLAAPVLAKIAFATAALDDESKAKMRTASKAMLRWVDMSGGLKDADTFNKLADMGWKLTQSSGGNVDWEQMRQFSAISGVAGQFITPEGLAALEPIIGELKGSTTGKGLRTAFNRMEGVVKLPKTVSQFLVDNKIFDEKNIEGTSMGAIKNPNGTRFKFGKELQQNPTKFYEERILPIYEKLKFDAEERGRHNQLIFGSTGGAAFTLIDKQLPVIHRSVEAVKKFYDISKSVEIGREGLNGKEIEFKAAWEDFKTNFGTKILPFFSSILRFGSGLLRDPPSTQEAPKFNDLTIPQRIRETLGGALGLIPGFGPDKPAAMPITGAPALAPSLQNKGVPFKSMLDGPKSQPLTMGSPSTVGKFGIDTIKPVVQPKSSMPTSIQLVPTQGGRPLAEYMAGKLAKSQFGAMGSGSFDLNVAQPAVNLRTN